MRIALAFSAPIAALRERKQEQSRVKRVHRGDPSNSDLRSPSSLQHEVVVGGFVGMISCALFALHFGASFGGSIIAASLGLAIGIVVGALLWTGSPELAEERIRAVRRSVAPSPERTGAVPPGLAHHVRRAGSTDADPKAPGVERSGGA